MPTQATFRIWRGDPVSGGFTDYVTPVEEGMVVLDAVHRIQAEQAPDLAVRLKYAGVEAEAPQTDPGDALDALLQHTKEGETAHLLCTYTAMLDLRAELVRRGAAHPYWET